MGELKEEPMIFHYILDEQGNPIAEPDPFKWAIWFGSADRRVAETYFGAIRVSTVFLGLPHISKELDTDEWMLYETMVFADDATLKRLTELSETDDRSIIMHFLNALGGEDRYDIQKRYKTKEEALKGHRTMCVFIETCLVAGFLSGSEKE